MRQDGGVPSIAVLNHTNGISLAANQGNRKAKYNLGRLTLIGERCGTSHDVKVASDHIKYYIAEMVGYTKIRPISDDQNSVERWSHEYNQ